MFIMNNIYCASAIDKCQQTLDVVADNVTFMSNKFCKWVENSLKLAGNIKLKFKKNFKWLQEKIRICPVCGGINVDENGSRERLIIFSTWKEYFKIQTYVCKDKHENGESQFFETNIRDIVPKNSIYSHEFIETVKDHNTHVHAPLRVTADFLNRNDEVSVSHQTIENMIFKIENPNPIPSKSSGKYTFDSLWCKAHGGWNSFYLCMNDAANGNVVFDEIYSKETAANLDEYFETIAPYLPEEKYITVDLNPKYKEPLEKYGF
ncbi:hypothetical protein MBFIL_06430 [Methanobrevibacter filiformis]|uniref:DDE domain-containing protein n=2 Tax=Methanobrevibacter filiformis TaxID=55758 RepID=A0A166DBV9_9EURY|nr:hypothetical protein MBFIL_06430 [Methanobrevibacter filiformis]